MVRPTNWLAFHLLPLFLFASIDSVQSETIQERLIWPSVFDRNFGNPRVDIRKSNHREPRVTMFYPGNVVVVKASQEVSPNDIDRALSDHFLSTIWNRYLDSKAMTRFERRLRMREIIPITRVDFFRIGRCHLKNRTCGNPVEDDWWKVRMGMPLTASETHLLAITSLRWDDPGKKTFGHFAFALRERGGNGTRDSVYDFRAPWNLDRRPNLIEANNLQNNLKIRAIRENLYDWLYTQTEFRNNHVDMSFLAVHEEQVSLLRALDVTVHEAGNFRVLKKNCASLGRQFVNRLLPVDQQIPGDFAWADLPLQAHDKTVEVFGGAIRKVVIPSVTRERGNTPTSRSDLHRAIPSKSGSRPYSVLKAVPEIN